MQLLMLNLAPTVIDNNNNNDNEKIQLKIIKKSIDQCHNRNENEYDMTLNS